MPRHVVVGAVITAFTAVCLLPGVAHAEQGKKAGGKRPDPAKVFSKKDVDADGKLTLDEYKAGMPEKALVKADGRFKKLDTDGDGRLTLDEFQAGMKDRPKKSS